MEDIKFSIDNVKIEAGEMHADQVNCTETKDLPLSIRDYVEHHLDGLDLLMPHHLLNLSGRVMAELREICFSLVGLINQLLLHGPNVANGQVPEILYDQTVPDVQQEMSMKNYVHRVYLHNGLSWRQIYSTISIARRDGCITLINFLKQFIVNMVSDNGVPGLGQAQVVPAELM